MRSIDEAEAQRRFDQIVEDAQLQPVMIRKQGRDIAVVLSMAQYERLRDGAIRGFLDLRDASAKEASGAGLTEERLTDLLGVEIKHVVH